MDTDQADPRDFIYVCRLPRQTLPASIALDDAAYDTALHDGLLRSHRHTMRNRIKALDLEGHEYHRIRPFLARLRGCLAEGHPFAFHNADGAVVVITGYDDATAQFTGRDAHGPTVVPYATVTDPSAGGDFWTIRPADPERPKVQVVEHDPAHPARRRTEWANYRDPVTGRKVG